MSVVVSYSNGLVSMDPALSWPQVFRTSKGGVAEAERERLDIKFQWGDVELHFRGPSPLGIGDQSVLLAVIEVGQAHRKACLRSAEMAGRQGISQWLQQSSFDPEGGQVLIRTSLGQLARIARPDVAHGGPSLEAVRQSLRRMAETTIWQRHEKIELASRLLAWRIGCGEYVELALSARLSETLLGKRYRQVDLRERAELSSDVAKHIHFMWSCRVNPGHSYSVKVETLQGHVYGKAAANGAEYAPATLRQQKVRVLNAVRDIAALERWVVEREGNGIQVRRLRDEKLRRPRDRRVQLFGTAAPPGTSANGGSTPGSVPRDCAEALPTQ